MSRVVRGCFARALCALSIVASASRAAQAQSQEVPPPPPPELQPAQPQPGPTSVSVRPVDAQPGAFASMRVDAAPQQRVVLQLDSHMPALPIFRSGAGGVQRLCVTPCALQVAPGPFDFSTDAAGRDLRVINVPASGLQMYVDAEAAGGIAAQRVDGRAVTGNQTVSYDGQGRDVGIALIITGGAVSVPSLIAGPAYLVTFAGVGRAVGSGGDSFLFYAGVGFTTLGLVGAGVAGLGFYFTQQGTRRVAPRAATAAVVPTPTGVAVAGVF